MLRSAGNTKIKETTCLEGVYLSGGALATMRASEYSGIHEIPGARSFVVSDYRRCAICTQLAIRKPAMGLGKKVIVAANRGCIGPDILQVRLPPVGTVENVFRVIRALCTHLPRRGPVRFLHIIAMLAQPNDTLVFLVVFLGRCNRICGRVAAGGICMLEGGVYRWRDGRGTAARGRGHWQIRVSPFLIRTDRSSNGADQRRHNEPHGI